MVPIWSRSLGPGYWDRSDGRTSDPPCTDSHRRPTIGSQSGPRLPDVGPSPPPRARRQAPLLRPTVLLGHPRIDHRHTIVKAAARLRPRAAGGCGGGVRPRDARVWWMVVWLTSRATIHTSSCTLDPVMTLDEPPGVLSSLVRRPSATSHGEGGGVHSGSLRSGLGGGRRPGLIGRWGPVGV